MASFQPGPYPVQDSSAHANTGRGMSAFADLEDVKGWSQKSKGELDIVPTVVSYEMTFEAIGKQKVYVSGWNNWCPWRESNSNNNILIMNNKNASNIKIPPNLPPEKIFGVTSYK